MADWRAPRMINGMTKARHPEYNTNPTESGSTGGMQPPRLLSRMLDSFIRGLKLEKPGLSMYIGREMTRAMTQARAIRSVMVDIFRLVA